MLQETIEIKSATDQIITVNYSDNVIVQFNLFWNTKYNCWYMDIIKNDVVLAYSVPLVLLSNLYNNTYYLGALYLVDTEYYTTTTKPVKSDLGTRLKLIRIYDPNTIQ